LQAHFLLHIQHSYTDIRSAAVSIRVPISCRCIVLKLITIAKLLSYNILIDATLFFPRMTSLVRAATRESYGGAKMF